MRGRRLGLVPLDERPVSTQLPRMVAAIAGTELAVPPADVLGRFREPGEHADLRAWLDATAGQVDGWVVALDQLVHGGLVPSRLSRATVDQLLGRLAALDRLAAPDAGSVAVFGSVLRWPNSTDATEEPAAWSTHGPALHRLGAAFERAHRGVDDPGDVDRARAEVPAPVLTELVQRRLRNHVLLLAALERTTAAGLGPFVACVDDAAPFSIAGPERDAVASWVRRLGADGRAAVHTGLDEVASLLVARAAIRDHPHRPRFAVHCLRTGGLDAVAPYEDRPVDAVVSSALALTGAMRVEHEPDVVLVVHAPDPGGGDWAIGPQPRPDVDEATAVARHVASLLDDGHAVAVADVAFANGADPALVVALAKQVDLSRLAAYGGWNTAANTIGGAVAQAATSVLPHHDAGANERLLAHRFVDDWGHQAVARQQLRAALRDRAAADIDVPAFLGERLASTLDALPGLDERWRLDPTSVALPWDQTFHVAFELEPRP